MTGVKRKHVSIFGGVEESESSESSSQVTIPTIETKRHGDSSGQRSPNERSSHSLTPISGAVSSQEPESSDAGVIVGQDAELRAYRELMENLSALESSNLTRHLVSHYQNTGRSKSTFVSPQVAWPMEPDVVPRSSSQVWPDSILPPSDWRPSAELQETVFAVMLKQARIQWQQRETDVEDESEETASDHSSSQSSKIQKTDSEPSKQSAFKPESPPEASARAASSPSTTDSSRSSARPASDLMENIDDRQSSVITTTDASTVKPRNSKSDYPVFSADDGRSSQMLNPSIRNVLFSVDQVLMGLHKSNNRTYRWQKSRAGGPEDSSTRVHATSKGADVGESRKRPRRDQFRLRDWSHVMGVAARAGVAADVISRASARCAATFGESMEFSVLEEHLANQPPKLVSFSPGDFNDATTAAEKLSQESEPFTWDKEDGCPFQKCKFYRKRALTPKAKKDIVQHLRKIHGWVLRDGLEKLSEMVRDSLDSEFGNGVHLDGYMQSLPAKTRYNEPKKLQKSGTVERADDQEDSEPPDDRMEDVRDGT
jgi:hypothetical protein